MDFVPIKLLRMLILINLSFAMLLHVAVLCVNFKHENTPIPLVQVHPPSATRILLPDGRNMSYLEQGVSANRARYSLIAPHSFLSSRLAGIHAHLKSLSCN